MTERAGMMEKPPLGIKPAGVRNLERRIEILEAMLRYEHCYKVVPSAWIQELNQLYGLTG